MDSAVLLDKAGRIINWNNGAASLFGYTKKEVIGRSINFIYDRNYPFPKLIQEISSQQKKWQEDTIFIRKNGIKGHCKSYLCSLPPNEQNKITALLINQNISSYKKVEEDLLKEQNMLRQQLQHVLGGFSNASGLLINLLHQLGTNRTKIT